MHEYIESLNMTETSDEVAGLPPQESYERASTESEQLNQKCDEFARDLAHTLDNGMKDTLKEMPFFDRPSGPKLLEYLAERGLDKFEVEVLTGAEAATWLKEVGLTGIIDEGILVDKNLPIIKLQLPKPVAQWWRKGLPEDVAPRDSVDVDNMVIEWGSVYRTSVETIWHEIRGYTANNEIDYIRINPEGLHTKDYYYVWLLQDLNNFNREAVNFGARRAKMFFHERQSDMTIEKATSDIELQTFLKMHAATCLELEGRKPLGTVLRFKHNQELPAELPLGYGFIGGAARNLILKELGENVLPPRDLDIIGLKEFAPDVYHMNELSRKLMPDDYATGHGVKLEGFDQYFNERDFVMNEILVIGEYAYVTPQALADLKNKIIRPTENEKYSWDSSYGRKAGLFPKLAAKALRLQLEFEHMYGEGKGQIEEIEEWQFHYEALPPFYLALHLEKALSRGDEIAAGFYEKLLERGKITRNPSANASMYAEDAQDLAMTLRWRMQSHPKGAFEFTWKDLNDYTRESNFDPKDEETDYYFNLAERESARTIDKSAGVKRYSANGRKQDRLVPYPARVDEDEILLYDDIRYIRRHIIEDSDEDYDYIDSLGNKVAKEVIGDDGTFEDNTGMEHAFQNIRYDRKQPKKPHRK